MREFFAMGGFAAYVWPAYAVFFLVLATDLIVTSRRRRKFIRQLRAILLRQALRRRSP